MTLLDSVKNRTELVLCGQKSSAVLAHRKLISIKMKQLELMSSNSDSKGHRFESCRVRHFPHISSVLGTQAILARYTALERQLKNRHAMLPKDVFLW